MYITDSFYKLSSERVSPSSRCFPAKIILC